MGRIELSLRGRDPEPGAAARMGMTARLDKLPMNGRFFTIHSDEQRLFADDADIAVNR